MTAAVVHENGQPLVVEETAKPEPAAGEVLVSLRTSTRASDTLNPYEEAP
jgi:Zn-dependent alcohol dehydrogenase